MRPDAVRPMTIGSPPIVPSPRTMAGNDFIQHEHVASEGRQADLSRVGRDADPSGRAGPDDRFGVSGAAEVVVQVAALRHPVQKRPQQWRHGL